VKKWLVAMALAQALDASTTCIGLSRGYAETNPLLTNKSCSQIVAIKGGMTVGSSLALVALRKKQPKSKWPQLAAFIFSGTAAAAGGWNAHILWSLR
jgi:hypothetical protein